MHWPHWLSTGNVAFVLSLLVGLWTFAQWRLEGGRVRVRLHAGLLTEYSLQSSTSSWSNLADNARQGWHREVAVVEVENPGRTAVTISAVGLDFGRVKWWRRWRHHIVPVHLKHSGDDVTTERKVRLEPFDRAVWLMDPWSCVQPVSSDSGVKRRPVRVRAQVRVAGVRRRERSPWRKRWKIDTGQVSFIEETIEPGMAFYRSAVRVIGEHHSITYPLIIPMALEARKVFPIPGPAPTKDQIDELIAKHTHGEPPAGSNIMWSFYMEKDLAYHYNR